MFKKSKWKIVAVIMAILVALWVGTLGVIYTSSYLKMSDQNRQMLKIHADNYNSPYLFPTDKLPQPAGAPSDVPLDTPKDTPMFRLSVFYTVAVSAEGKTLEIRNSVNNVYSDEELEKLAYEIRDGHREYGTIENLAYYKTEKVTAKGEGCTLVVFMDNTVINENAMMLIKYTFFIGGLAIILFFFLSVFLAGKIVEPLEESYERQKQFISDAGHELKTPVSVVSANAELLEREIGENQWLSNIQYENQRMGSLVGQLLELARMDNVSMQMERLDFSRLTDGEVLPFESLAFEKGIEIDSKTDAGIYVHGNSSRLKQLVSIMLDNAVRHSTGGKPVKVRLSRERGWAVLSVINRGREIPEEQREKIFRRFYRADEARENSDDNYGLGLAIAKAIVTAHKGKIAVRCYEGMVEFNIRIPAENI